MQDRGRGRYAGEWRGRDVWRPDRWRSARGAYSGAAGRVVSRASSNRAISAAR